jgi:hypothetical protein
MISNPERTRGIGENGIETQIASTDQHEEISNQSEKKDDLLSPRDIESKIERARLAAISIEKDNKEVIKNKSKSISSRRGQINKKQRNDSYKRTIKQVQDELPTSSRVFSKIIHNKLIEKTSDVVSTTIARPDAMLAGSVVAFIFTLITYITAKEMGYTLSGSETIVAFIIGWVVGIVYDYLRVIITGNRN